MPIEFFGGVDYYNTLKYHDNLKNDYCKNNNIPLLRIKNIKKDFILE